MGHDFNVWKKKLKLSRQNEAELRGAKTLGVWINKNDLISYGNRVLNSLLEKGISYDEANSKAQEDVARKIYNSIKNSSKLFR